ncbi:MAG: DUF4258 domain-containing protein [Thaumarchaeota archaeon]|nr:DUF4258 domain-containing protein [Nitrososphaerota archaeon]
MVDRIKVIPSRHCNEQMIMREITIEQIESVFNNPLDSYHDEKRQNYKTCGIVNNPLREEMPYLIVIHDKVNTSVKVITVMWADKGTLRSYEFDKIR